MGEGICKICHVLCRDDLLKTTDLENAALAYVCEGAWREDYNNGLSRRLPGRLRRTEFTNRCAASPDKFLVKAGQKFCVIQ